VRLPLILARQGDVLRASPSFRLLFGSTLISGLGTWIAVIALVVDVKDRTGSAVWVSALLIADFLPGVAIGLLFGPLVDRLSRKGLMIASDLGRLAVFAALPFAGSVAAIVLLAVLGVGGWMAWALMTPVTPDSLKPRSLPRPRQCRRGGPRSGRACG